jgi:Flp pilus assembly protein TadD
MSGAMRAQRLSATAAALACLLTAGYLGLHSRDESRVRRANELGSDNRLADAIREARRVSRAPASLRALAVEAKAATLLGDNRAAGRALVEALDRDPSNWQLHRDRAIVLLRTGDRRRARREMSRALALNPKMDLPRGFVRERR